MITCNELLTARVCFSKVIRISIASISFPAFKTKTILLCNNNKLPHWHSRPWYESRLLLHAAKKQCPKIICYFLSTHLEFQCQILHFYGTFLSTHNCKVPFNNF